MVAPGSSSIRLPAHFDLLIWPGDQKEAALQLFLAYPDGWANSAPPPADLTPVLLEALNCESSQRRSVQFVVERKKVD